MTNLFARLSIAGFGIAMAFSTSAFASDADFKLINKTGYQIDSVYVAATSSDDWGPDIMGRDSVPDGGSVDIVFPHGGSACKFDIHVKYNDGEKVAWSNVDLCQYQTISLYWDGKATRAVGE